jgi:hypothetical protein
MKELSAKLSKPLFEITKKYDEDVQELIEDDGEESVFAEYDISKAFAHSQEEIITPLKNKLKNQLAYRTFGCLKKLATF